jgi:hypothetical protein
VRSAAQERDLHNEESRVGLEVHPFERSVEVLNGMTQRHGV